MLFTYMKLFLSFYVIQSHPKNYIPNGFENFTLTSYHIYLSVPLITQRIDLIRKLRHIFICDFFIFMNYCDQALTCCQ